MQIAKLLGHRVLIQPIEEGEFSNGIYIPKTGPFVTNSQFYNAKILMVGSAPELAERRPEVQVGKTVVIEKSGYEQLEDGSRIVSIKDVVAVKE